MAVECLRCPKCGANYRASLKLLQHVGSSVRCALCRSVFKVNIDDIELVSNKDLARYDNPQGLHAQGLDDIDEEFHFLIQDSSPPPAATKATAKTAKPRRFTPKTSKEKNKNQTIGLAPSDLFDARILRRSTKTRRQVRSTKPLLWSLASLALVIILVMQVTWSQRMDPSINQPLRTACTYIGCDVDQVRMPEHIRINSRVFSALTENPGHYRLQLEIINDAAFNQPFPVLELALLNTAGEIRAKRQIDPQYYLNTEQKAPQLMPDTLYPLELVVYSGDEDTGGFMIEFL